MQVCMRVVLDTNVILSAFLWKRQLEPIYVAIRQRRVVPCFSPSTRREFQRALRYKKLEPQLVKIRLTPEEVSRLVASRAYFVPAVPSVSVIKTDLADNHILACALAAKAESIVSGDRHLLELDVFEEIPIITPSVFVRKLKEMRVVR